MCGSIKRMLYRSEVRVDVGGSYNKLDVRTSEILTPAYPVIISHAPSFLS